MKLYDYWRSTSSYRLRIALALKGLDVDRHPVHLVRGGGENNAASYRALNPQGRVPILELDDGTILTQSTAIIEFLEERYPQPPLLPPRDDVLRARIRAVASIIGCDIHPLHNLGPLTMLRREFGACEEQVAAWIARWTGEGLAAVETLIDGKTFCFGDSPTLADVYLLPQIYAARRFAVPIDHLDKIMHVERMASIHPAFSAAHPSAQPDAE